jgi:cytochrome c-type biogenesis protein CcmH
MNRLHRFFIVGLLLLLIPSAVAFAQDEGPTDDEVNAIARELYCPVCENVPLDVCPTQACEQWRGVIRDKLAEGWTEEQIQQYFVDQYGARVLATPPVEGFSVLVYILPPLAFILGAFILYRAFLAWRKPQGPAGVMEIEPIEDPYLARMEEEVRRRET